MIEAGRLSHNRFGWESEGIEPTVVEFLFVGAASCRGSIVAGTASVIAAPTGRAESRVEGSPTIACR
jgi:hypothetical protein